MFLAPYSPELQPAEKLWPLLRESVANRSFESIEALEEIIEKRCNYLAKEEELIRGHTLFHWWDTAEKLNSVTV